MPTPTYDLIATTTLGASSPEVVFSSIPATYRDLVLVLAGTRTGNNQIQFRFNSDIGTNYSTVIASGNGSGTSSSAETLSFLFSTSYALQTDTQLNTILQVMDYSATDKHKTTLLRFSQAGSGVSMAAGRWANTAAITSVQIYTANNDFGSGSVFSLYGIVA